MLNRANAQIAVGKVRNLKADNTLWLQDLKEQEYVTIVAIVDKGTNQLLLHNDNILLVAPGI